jgi:hypothetical protein
MMNAMSENWRDRLPDGSKSVQSVWVWRGFFFMSLIAVGLAISFADEGLRFYELMWTIIAVGWFGFSMWLWRKHVQDDNAASKAREIGGQQ